jgi:hypothetical protein
MSLASPVVEVAGFGIDGNILTLSPYDSLRVVGNRLPE